MTETILVGSPRLPNANSSSKETFLGCLYKDKTHVYKTVPKARKTTEQAKAFDPKADDLSSIPRTLRVEEGNQLHKLSPGFPSQAIARMS